MIQNFAATIVKNEVSTAWVSRFLHRYANELTIKWSTRIDRKRHNTNLEERYSLYFDLLHLKMRKYNVNARNTYNIDKKGFFISITNRTKRVFSKAL